MLGGCLIGADGPAAPARIWSERQVKVGCACKEYCFEDILIGLGGMKASWPYKVMHVENSGVDLHKGSPKTGP
jgi:hypothetical protein